jgi:hypothetical protein
MREIRSLRIAGRVLSSGCKIGERKPFRLRALKQRVSGFARSWLGAV